IPEGDDQFAIVLEGDGHVISQYIGFCCGLAGGWLAGRRLVGDSRIPFGPITIPVDLVQFDGGPGDVSEDRAALACLRFGKEPGRSSLPTEPARRRSEGKK